MKRQATVCFCSLILVVVGCGFVLARSAQARMDAHEGFVQSGDPPTPTVEEDIWGPGVALAASGPATKLVPMAIGDDQLLANSTIQSDDFNACGLDTGTWTFVDPEADATLATVGSFSDDAWLSISVPSIQGGHDIWFYGNDAPRIMQDVSDTDFEVEVKFESPVTQTYQMLGILVEEQSDHLLRFDFHSHDSDTRLLAAILEPDSPPPIVMTATVLLNDVIYDNSSAAPLWMRIQRQGDQWRQFWSDDGVNWTNSVTFTHELTVTKVGVFASNADIDGPTGQLAPAYTGYIDYFFNTASPIDPEDGERAILTVDTVGDGTVSKDPDKTSYGCEDVDLTANPSACWLFDSWSGDLSGSDNPDTISIDGSKTVTATFTADPALYTLTLNAVGNGTVAKDPDQSTYGCGQAITLTATPDLGWFFGGWSGDHSGTENPDTITIYGSQTVTGTFVSHRTFLPYGCKDY
jgi:regulation of enolase protein 1 (concanavalin A-like superfamily)